MKRIDIKIDEKLQKYIKWERKGKKFFYIDSRTIPIENGFRVHPVGIEDGEVYICCPYCGEFHMHGIGDVGCTGNREPHCLEVPYKGRYTIEYSEP